MTKYFILSIVSLVAFAGNSQQIEEKTKIKEDTLESVTILSIQENPYLVDSSNTVGKLSLKDLENPQVYNTISKNILKDQVVTNFNDALKNATGVYRLWESTGRDGDGAEFYSMRGFSLQPTMINGVVNIQNGALDPANVENLEVIKGPSGTLFGGNVVSYGGLININTKRPYDKFGGELGYVIGSFGQHRITADFNTPLSDKTSVRINGAYSYQNSFQDAGFSKSLFVAPSLKFKASKKLTFLINTELKNGESANAPMIFLGRYSTVSFSDISLFEKNYFKSFTSNALSIKNPSVGMQSQALYQINKNWKSQTIVSVGNAQSDGYYHYLWDNSDGSSFTRYISKRNSQTNTLNLQQNVSADHNFGKIRNRLVLGVDYLQKEIQNYSTGWVANGVVSLKNQTDSGTVTTQGVDALLQNSTEGVSAAKTQILGAYFSDVINFRPNLSVLASVRIDNFTGKPSTYAPEEIKSQTTLSNKFGVVYQPIINKMSLFANYMNGFVNLDPILVSDADGTNSRMKILSPEKANQFEVGTKLSILKNKLSATASYYNILVNNRPMTDPNNPNNKLQGGEIESKGLELSIVASPVSGLNIVTGISHNNNKVTKDAANGEFLGRRSEEAGPENLFNCWISYKVQAGLLKNWGIGLGNNTASEQFAINRNTTGTFVLPSYSVFNGSVSYQTSSYGIILKINNIANEKYYTGWSTVSAQKTRNISLALNYKF